ncbi:helix-turn-helix domain-containing protein [uncultured Aquitalea sp.]|uniref:helix-turn-helix domain-containing protein n=1 Tax=uncultured Aquitalea sp. TaxID=540272 RepID=UPI0025D8BF6C|nr:helix-turn-helix domain-containing protein [uncultured Aquitalea sp.]
MKAAFEHVTFGEGCSVRVYHRQLQRIPFEWHHHPEYELTLTLSSAGKRYVGDDIADYRELDLVLLPPDLPHSWASDKSGPEDETQENEEALVIWFDGDWARRLASCCPEYAALPRLLRQAGCGLAFEESAAREALAKRQRLLSPEPATRLAAALELLCALADAPARPLASPGAFIKGGQPSGRQPERVNRLLATMEARLAEALTVDELAALANLSPRSLHRYFQQHLGESVTRHLARLRIGQACRLLVDTMQPITLVATRCGYANLAHFNRQFRQFKDMTPSQYRRRHSNAAPQQDAPALTARSPSLEKTARPAP